MICWVQQLRLPVQQAYTGPANKLLKTQEYSDSISKILLKPIRIAAKYVFASSNFLKTHANSIESLIISNMFLKTHAYSMHLEKITLKPMRIATKMKIRNQPPERRTSLQDSLQRWEFLASRAHAASPRPLARTHDTNTKRNRNRFPGWVVLPNSSPQPPIFICSGAKPAASTDICCIWRHQQMSGQRV